MKTAYVEIRSQRVRGIFPRCSPDKYVAVQIVPEGVKPLRVLRCDAAKKRGIEIIYCGEGYSTRNGPRSMFGKARAKAWEVARQINGE